MTAGGFPHSEILGSKPCWRLPEAYRSLTRPSSVLSAKASTKRPSRTTRHTRAATRQSQQIHRTTDLRTNDRKTIERSPTRKGREPRNHNKANQDNPKKTNGRPVRSRPLSSSQTTTRPDNPSHAPPRTRAGRRGLPHRDTVAVREPKSMFHTTRKSRTVLILPHQHPHQPRGPHDHGAHTGHKNRALKSP